MLCGHSPILLQFLRVHQTLRVAPAMQARLRIGSLVVRAGFTVRLGDRVSHRSKIAGHPDPVACVRSPERAVERIVTSIRFGAALGLERSINERIHKLTMHTLSRICAVYRVNFRPNHR
jgi:hypothetical protein